MSLSNKISFAVRCALPLLGFVLADCVVRSNVAQPAAGTLTVQPAQTTVQYQQPVVQTQVQYQQPMVNAGVSVQPVTAPIYSAPPGVVGGGWMTTGYAENDYVSYHMTLRARQFAAGYMPITQMYRSQMGQGGREYVTVTATPGRCYRIIGVGGVGVRDLDLRLRDMNGNVIDQDVATDNFPVLGLQRQLCLNWAGSFQVEIIMYSGGGEFGVQAFATP